MSEIISRLNVNLGYDYENAIFEAIDDSFEAANKPTGVDCWLLNNEARGLSYIVADLVGEVDLNKLFNGDNGEFNLRFNAVAEIKSKTGMFGSGSNSHPTVSKKVYFFTKKSNLWTGLKVEREFKTGTAIKKYIAITDMDESEVEILNSLNFEMDKYQSFLFAVDVNSSTFQSIKDFEEEKAFIGFERNLRATYKDKLKEGYKITFNGKLLAPLDIFYYEDSLRHELLSFDIKLKELLKINPFYKEQIYEVYLPLFKNELGSGAEQELLNEKIKVNFFGYDSKFYNEQFFKVHKCDKVTFNQESSGAWLYRNNRKIGNPYRLKFMRSPHNSWNRLRIEIAFNPIFDAYFNINVNKNTGTVGKVIENIIEEKVKSKFRSIEKLKNDLSEINYGNMKDSTQIYDDTDEQQMEFDLGENPSFIEDDEDDDVKVKEHWQNAEELVRLELIRNGFAVEDKRTSGFGYDFKAIHSISKEIRYVEVKRVKNEGEVFRLTRNEFKQAKEHEEKYYFYLVILWEKSVQFLVFNNLIKNADYLPTVNMEVFDYKLQQKYKVDYSKLD